MAGRNRKPGRRTANGRLAKPTTRSERQDTITSTVTSQPHRAWLKEGRRLDQRAESALGRLFLAHAITETECWAGERFRNLLREFHVVLAAPVTASSAAIMVAETVCQDAEGDELAPEHSETDEERRDRVLAQFERAKRALGRLDRSKEITSGIDALVMRDVLPADLALVRSGLQALARLWRIFEDEADEARRPIRVNGKRFGERAAWPHDERIVEIQYKG